MPNEERGYDQEDAEGVNPEPPVLHPPAAGIPREGLHPCKNEYVNLHFR